MFARTPAYQYVAQARRLEQEKKIDEAIAQFTEAIKVGPEWPEPYLGRGNIYTRQEKFDKARPDFDKALELDPWNSQALTGICVAMVMQDDDVSPGIQRLESHRTKFESDAVFDYNAACVYARAVERLEKMQSNEERAAAIEKYSNQAIADLKKSVERGFRDFKWMREDPDLESLHTRPEFRKVSQMPDEKEGADDEADDQPSEDAAAGDQ